MKERTHFSVGSYSQLEIDIVLAHAKGKGIGCKTIKGPIENLQLADGSSVSVPAEKTAVVLISNDPSVVLRFWNGFPILILKSTKG